MESLKEASAARAVVVVHVRVVAVLGFVRVVLVPVSVLFVVGDWLVMDGILVMGNSLVVDGSGGVWSLVVDGSSVMRNVVFH